MKKRNLKIIRILEYYDVPQLFIAEDVLGMRYLCQLYDIENNGELKVVGVSVSAEKLNDFLKGCIELLSMFRYPEAEDSIYSITMKEDSISAERFIGILDDSMLPNEGYYYDDSLENSIPKGSKFLTD